MSHSSTHMLVHMVWYFFSFEIILRCMNTENTVLSKQHPKSIIDNTKNQKAVLPFSRYKSAVNQRVEAIPNDNTAKPKLIFLRELYIFDA